MKLIIDISENLYHHYKKVWKKRKGSIPESCIAFGTPLPEGHGRLIDADQLLKEARDIVVPVYPHGYEYRCYCVPADSIYEAPTIIEADKEVEDEQVSSQWIDVPIGQYILLYRCPKCLRRSDRKSKYCPNCGKKMEVKNESISV